MRKCAQTQNKRNGFKKLHPSEGNRTLHEVWRRRSARCPRSWSLVVFISTGFVSSSVRCARGSRFIHLNASHGARGGFRFDQGSRRQQVAASVTPGRKQTGLRGDYTSNEDPKKNSSNEDSRIHPSDVTGADHLL